MKRFFAIVLAWTLLSGGVSLAVPNAAKTEEAVSYDATLSYALDAGQTTLTVNLKGNPTTGYEWSYKASAEDILEEAQSDYKPDPNPDGLTGSGGTFAFVFAGISKASGKVSLLFQYMRSWEAEAISAYEIAVTVSQNGEITVDSVDMPDTEHESLS